MIPRRLSVVAIFFLSFLLPGCAGGPESVARPNVLFISVDDLNDWIEPLGGHPQARTPNLERFARKAVTFRRNYCASPACLPSRVALLTGIHTYRSGIYSNYQNWREVLPEAVTLPEYFRRNGYWVGGAGKIFHNNQPDPGSWDDYYPSREKHMPDYFYPQPGETVSMPRFENMYRDFDWSPIDIPDEETGDGRSVDWVIEQLGRKHDKPFFLAAGIYRPHVPWYVPRKYFDMFPLETLELPLVLENDVGDVGDRAREIARRAGDYHKHVVEADQWKKAVQGYLASIAFADALVGKLLDALEKSEHGGNTIVMLWSDHGWQLGEKQHWRKFALWENVARTVLIARAPKGTPGLEEGSADGVFCNRVTSLLDLYPTLVKLCGLPEKTGLDGRSLVPLLRNPALGWKHAAVTTYDYSEFSIRTEDWRYTKYIDDSEELYDHRVDPEEWDNLARDSRYRDVLEELQGYLPESPAPLAETSYRLSPHHVRPLTGKEDYLKNKK